MICNLLEIYFRLSNTLSAALRASSAHTNTRWIRCFSSCKCYLSHMPFLQLKKKVDCVWVSVSVCVGGAVSDLQLYERFLNCAPHFTTARAQWRLHSTEVNHHNYIKVKKNTLNTKENNNSWAYAGDKVKVKMEKKL